MITLRPGATLQLAASIVIAVLACSAAQAAPGGYDDAVVYAVSVSEAAPSGTGKMKVTCKYGYQNTGTVAGYQVPWTAVQFYLRDAGSTLEVFNTAKSCVGPACSAESFLPPIPAPGRTVGCRIVDLQNSAMLPDAIKTNNQKEIFVAAGGPGRNATARTAAGGAAHSMGIAGVAAPDGAIKQCQTSLSASVTPASQQFAGPLFGPADFSPGTIMLHLVSSQAAGNQFVCRYASHGKDVGDFAVTVKCPNAAPRAGTAHAYGCTS